MASGTNSNLQARYEADEETVFRVLNREDPIAALDALVSALDLPDEEWPVSSTAIAIDTNVFLRMASHKNGEDMIDYLVSEHESPVILPGQAITEFWNNQLAAVETVAKGLENDFDKFKKGVQAINDEFATFSDAIIEILEEFRNKHGHVYDAGSVHRTRNLLDALRQRAIVPFVNRTRFQTLADHRRRTKTPPGFEDARDGDFFVWADFLLGLKIANSDGVKYEKVAFITNERKKDWMRYDVAHPILTAEAMAVSGVSFAIWSLDKLAERIDAND